MPGRLKLDLALDRELLAVDDIDLAGQFGGYPKFLAVGRGGEAARAGADHDVLLHIAAVGVDQMHEIADLRRNVDVMPVFADEHALGLGAGRDFLDDDVLVHVDDRKRGPFFVGNVDATALLVDPEGFRTRSGGQLADHFELGHVDDVDHVVVAAGHVKFAVIGAEMHVARAPRRLQVLDQLVGLGVDDDDVVGLFVRHEDQPGILGGADRAQRGNENGTTEQRQRAS